MTLKILCHWSLNVTSFLNLMRFAKTILLTGAGFTKTFGGFLGSEMWAAIFNQPEVGEDNKLREYMLRVILTSKLCTKE